MTHKENITAILECHFQGFKEEIIESACNRILEQEPCEDCISRKAVLDCFKKWQPYMATRIFEYEQELKALPSIQPKAKVGHWIKQKVGWKCSNCDLCTNDAGQLTYCYCPRCGFKMNTWEGAIE